MTLLSDRAAAHRVSLAEFERFRDERDDGSRYELLDGEVLVTPSPVRVHQRVVTRLLVLLAPCWWSRSSPPRPGGATWVPSGDSVSEPVSVSARPVDLVR